MNMDNAGYECAFFCEKLGMLFNTHDSKLTVVGLDSHLYGQTALSNIPSAPTPSQVENDTATKDAYHDAITLNPTLTDGDSTTSHVNLIDNPILVEQAESQQEAVEKFLDAFANFDDGSSPVDRENPLSSSGDCDCFFEVTDEPTTASVPIPAPDLEPTIDFNMPNSVNEEGVVASESFNDFQNTLASMSNSTKYVNSADAALKASSDPTIDNLSLEIPAQDVALTGEGSPFDFHHAQDRKDRQSNEAKPDWLPPAPSAPIVSPVTPSLPSPSAPPSTTALPPHPSGSLPLSIETAQAQGKDSADAIADNYGLASPSSNRSQFAASRERARLLQLFGFHSSYVHKTHLPGLAKAINTGSCEERKWVLSKSSAEQFIGCSVEYVNGVKVADLDPAFQQALLKQRSRPLLMQFQPTSLLSSPSERGTNDTSTIIPGAKVAAPVTEKFPYALFMAKYTSTAASKIRSTVDSTLQDYVQCNWADVKSKGEGLPQITIVSIYKYIECEMHKLDLFTHSHARGYGVPVEMKEEHWDDIRGHIESMVYKAIGAHTRTLWPIFCQDDNNQLDRSERGEFVDAETAASDLKTNTFIGVDLSISSTHHAERNVYAAEGEPEVTSTPRVAPPMVELSAEHPLRMKLAFLRFVTLESTGLDCGHDKPKQTDEDGDMDRSFTLEERGKSLEGNQISTTNAVPELETPSVAPVCAKTLQEQLSSPATRLMIQKIRRINRIMLRHKEEWYLAMRGLCRAMQLETPGNVLHALVNTVKLIFHALDAYINHREENNPAVEEVLQDTCSKCNAYRGGHISCTCGKVHLVTESDKEVSLSLTSTSENLSGEMITDLFAGTRCLTLARDPHQPESHDEINENNGVDGGNSAPIKKKKKEHRPLSADDLMPAITWVLIQANPPNIEYMVWMCTEFRHPNLLRGEEAFCLAQLSSAVEFCKHATHRAFDIPHGDYNALMLSYNNTLKLLLACKVGNLNQVKELVEHGNADVNGLSPDHKDSPLTACIKFGQHAILRYLLSRPEIDADAPVQLFHGPDQRSTPLMLAVQYNQFDMVIDLLVTGADRHYCNDAGDSALSTAVESELALESLVLKADPAQCELVSQIIEGKKLVVVGLLLQKVPVNYLLQPENSLSPLIAAVLKRDTEVIRFLLNKRLCNTDVNLVNGQGETALIACAKEFAQNPSQELLTIAAMLIRFGANRHLRDSAGLSALEYIRSARDAIKTLERTVHNPFGGNSDGTNSTQAPPVPISETESVPPVPAKDALVSKASSVTSPVPQKRHSAIVSPSTQSPFVDVNDSRFAGNTTTNNINEKAANAVRTESGTETPPPMSSAPAESPVKVNPVHKQLLKEFSLLLANDPLSDDAVPIFELARDKKINDVRSLLYQGVNVNAVCVSKGYSALIAAVYNSDLPMLQLILQADEICKQTYFTTQYSILSAVKSLLHGTPDTLEADADLLVNDEGIIEGEKGGYLRIVDPADPLFVSDDGEIKLVSKRNTVDLDRAGRYGMRALHYASQIGNISIVGALLQAGAAREVYNDKLHTPLDVCVANDHIDAANAIRFDPERVSICLAAKHGDWVVMSALLCQGVSINTQRNHMSKTGDQVQHELYTPLLAAAAHGQVEVIKKILDVPEVNVNLANSLNQTALMFAAARGDEAVVLLLLSKGADRWVLDKQGYIATAWAESRNRESVATILKHDPSRIWIHDVIRNNDFPAVIAMLKQKVDPNLRRTTKLVPHSPAMTSASAKVTHVNMDTIGNNKMKGVPSKSAAAAPSKSAPMKLNPSIDQHHDTSAAGSGFIHGETPLIVAARYGRLDVIAILLKAPPPQAVDMTLTDSAGNSALHHAALKGHEDTVLLLLKSHAARHMRNHMGLNASAIAKSAGFINIAAIIDADPHTVHIHDMCEQGDTRMVVALLKQGCPVNYKDPRASKRQQTPLMAAAIGGQADIVRMLLRDSDAQAHIDDQDSVGRTALMRAASVGALSVTAVLLNAGCDRTLKDHQGMTARDHASKHSYTVMFQFISQSMVR